MAAGLVKTRVKSYRATLIESIGVFGLPLAVPSPQVKAVGLPVYRREWTSVWCYGSSILRAMEVE
jgi:hypothetical protein